MSFSGWEKIRVGDIGQIITGKTPKTQNKEYYDGNIPFLTPSDNMDIKWVRNTLRKLTDSGVESVGKCLLPEKSICVSCIGSQLGKVVMTTEPTVTNQQINSIIPSCDFDPDFIYYNMLILGNELNYLSKTSTAVPIVNKSSFSSFTIQSPPLQEQKAIAHILSTLDEKIETNNKISKTLEEMAQAIFKHWFVDFEFPNEDGEPYKSSGGEMVDSELGPIPKGWEVGKIGNYMKVKSGYAFKSQWWTDEGIPVVKIKNLANGIVNYDDVGYVSIDKVSLAKDFIVKSGDILIAMTGATIGKIGLVYEFSNIVLVNQRVGKFFIGDDPFMKLPFAYVLLTNNRINEEIISLGGGSAQPNVSPSQIENIKIAFPLDNKIEIFNDLLNSSFRKLVENIKENERLKQIRDTLLPKLMSGEIRVPIDNEQ